MIKRTASLLMYMLVAILMAGCYAYVDPNETGLRIDTWGKNRGTMVEVGPGRHGDGLGVEYRTVSHTIQRVVWAQVGDESGADRAIRVVSKDDDKFIIDVGFAYHVDTTKGTFYNMYFKYRTDDLDKLTNGIMRDIIADAVIRTASQFTTDSLYGEGLPAFQTAVTKEVRQRLKPEGFIIDQFAIRRIVAEDPELQQAIANRSRAKQEAVQAEERLRKEIADARADSVKIAALARQNDQLAQTITPQLLEKMRLENEARMLEKWNGQLPTTIVPSYNPFSVFSRQ